MKILSSVPEIQSLRDFWQGDTPIALTAPFRTPDRVLIGLYGSMIGHACIEVSHSDFEVLKVFLYEPRSFRLAVHGIQRIWRSLNLGSLYRDAPLIIDTELMAYLLNSSSSIFWVPIAGWEW
jgi:hypothetical protein